MSNSKKSITSLTTNRNMRMNNKEVIISGLHIDLTEALKNLVNEKAEKLFQHQERIIRLRVELEYNLNKGHGKSEEFIAKGHIEIDGRSHDRQCGQR